MARRIRVPLLLIIPLLFLPLLPTATAQADGDSSCAVALAAANSGATRWQGYKIIRAPQQGGPGSDVVLGTSGNDDLRGGPGNDLVCGFDGNDVLRGGPANDTLVGGPGADTLYGESGDDHLIGGPGADKLNGDSGDDRIVADAQDVVTGGPGETRIIRVTPTATPITPTATPITPTATPVTPTATPVTPTATPVTPTPTPEDPLVTRCRQDATAAGFDGSAFTQVLVGTEGDDNYNFTYITTGTLVCSFGGADTAYAMDGTAVFLAGDGNDFLTNLDGGTFNGDGGDDRVSQCYPGGTFNGGAGTNTIQYPMGCGYTQVEDPYARSSGSRIVQPAPVTATVTEQPVIPTTSPITPTLEPVTPTAESVTPTVAASPVG